MMKHRSLPPLIALSTVLLAGFVFSVTGLRVAPSRLHDPSSVDLPGLINGEWAASFDRRLEDGHPWRSGAVSAVSILRYLLFRDLPDIVVGREGILFTEEEILASPADESTLHERTRMILEYADAITERGAIPVVLLLPSKARIYENALPRRFREQARRDRYDRTLQALRGAGITTVDPREALRALPPGEGFFRRDSHWTPQGAGAVARTVAEALRSPDGSARIAAILAGKPETKYHAEPGDPVEVPGDLMNFLPVGPLREALDMPVEHALRPRYNRETASPGLFGAIEIPILLVGTSYSADERWAFDLHLGSELSLDVLNLATVGEGPFAPMERLLENDQIHEYRAAVVVWEIPERYLTIDLPSP